MNSTLHETPYGTYLFPHEGKLVGTVDRFSAQGELNAMVADLDGALKQRDMRAALARWHADNAGVEPEADARIDEIEVMCRKQCEEFAQDAGAELPDDFLRSEDCRKQFTR